MNDSELLEMRRRIRELLSVPDRDRTDAEWDELNELEIRTAPGNRIDLMREKSHDKRASSTRRPERQRAPKAYSNQSNQSNQSSQSNQSNQSNMNSASEPNVQAQGDEQGAMLAQEGRSEGNRPPRRHHRRRRPSEVIGRS